MPNGIEDACADFGCVDVTLGDVGEPGVMHHLEPVRVGATSSALLATSGAVDAASGSESRGVSGRRAQSSRCERKGERQSSIAASRVLTGRLCAQLARKRTSHLAHLAFLVDGLNVGRARRPGDYGAVEEGMVGSNSRLASIERPDEADVVQGGNCPRRFERRW